MLFFFFQAEDGIRDLYVTGVQTCALPISLAQAFTVIRFDRPGCGLSDRAAADFSIDGEIELFDRLVAWLGVDRPAVLASASAARVMIAVAALLPDRVRRL